MNIPARTRKQGSIVREMLKTPVYKDVIRASLTSMGHGKESPATRALMEEDPEVFLALMTSIPALVNMLLRSLTELGSSLKSQYTPDLLVTFLESILDDIDHDTLRKCGSVWQELILSLWSSSNEFRKGLLDLVLASGPNTAAQAINLVTRAANDLERDKPGAMSAFMTDMLSHVDGPAASQSTRILAEAVLDQKWHVVSWLYGLASSRIRKRFGRKAGSQG